MAWNESLKSVKRYHELHGGQEVRPPAAFLRRAPTTKIGHNTSELPPCVKPGPQLTLQAGPAALVSHWAPAKAQLAPPRSRGSTLVCSLRERFNARLSAAEKPRFQPGNVELATECGRRVLNGCKHVELNKHGIG